MNIRSLWTNRKIRPVIISVLAAMLTTLAVGVLDVAGRLDRWAEDAIYQKPRSLDGKIIVIGIDDKALEEIGPYNTWDRNIMASALEELAKDPENLPAVVAIDTQYTGRTIQEADQRLADAAGKLGNVITATFASIGPAVVEDENGKMILDKNAVYSYSRPYKELEDVTAQGHINAMTDSDGIMRHALLTVSPEGGKVYSMAYTAAKMYAENNGYDILLPGNESDSLYVSYSALPGGYYDGYSIYDLINGDIGSDAYAGRIVFIGPYAVGLQDTFFTAIDHGRQMYGVEYQANVTQMMLDGNYKREAAKGWQILALFIVCFAVFYIFQIKGNRVSSVVALAAISLSIITSYIAYNNGIVLHPLWIPAGVFILYITAIAIRYAVSVFEKQQITRTFERYVAPEIVSEILNEGPENLSLGGKLTDIAVLFVDVRGFTAMSERLSPENVVYILNRYLTMASDCVEKNGGTLDKFVGDAMMAFWGAPIASDDFLYKAVVTAKEIVEGAVSVSKELTKEIGEELNVGVGVHFGPAVVGNMGSEKHMDYTAIGDTVNTAARLEANAPGGEIYISREVADRLEGRIKYSSLGNTVRLKGKSPDFEVLRLE